MPSLEAIDNRCQHPGCGLVASHFVRDRWGGVSTRGRLCLSHAEELYDKLRMWRM